MPDPMAADAPDSTYRTAESDLSVSDLYWSPWNRVAEKYGRAAAPVVQRWGRAAAPVVQSAERAARAAAPVVQGAERAAAPVVQSAAEWAAARAAQRAAEWTAAVSTPLADSTSSIKGAAAVSTPLSESSSSNKGAAGSVEKRPTSPAKGVSLSATGLVLTAVVAVAVPILLLVRFHGHPMSQVWVLSVSIYLYVFLLLRIYQSQWFYIDILRLSYGPLLASFSSSQIGSATTIFVLLFSTVWAAGNLGYSLAVHRLRKGAELGIHAVPSPSCPTKVAKELNLTLYSGAPFVVLLWTLLMAVFLNVATLTDELDILMFLSYFGWIHVAAWLIIVAMVPMDGFLHKVLMEWILPALFPWMLISPAICLISQILAVLCHLLLMVALAAFLWYDLAIYMHFLATASPSKTTQGNKGTMHSKIPEGKIGQVNSDPRVGETASEAAATLLNEDTPMNTDILEDKIRQVKSGPRLRRTLSDSASTLGNEIPRQIEIPKQIEVPRQIEVPKQIEILEDKIGQMEDTIGQMEFVSITWGNHRRTSSC